MYSDIDNCTYLFCLVDHDYHVRNTTCKSWSTKEGKKIRTINYNTVLKYYSSIFRMF